MAGQRTLVDKIWDDHVVAEDPGAPSVLAIDLHLVHEVTSPQAFTGLRRRGLGVRHPERTVATADHSVPTTPRNLPILDELAAAGATNPQAGRHGLRLSELRAARTDVLVGMAFSNLVMYFIILTSAAVLHAHGKTGIQTAAEAAAALAPLAGPFAFIVFSVGLIGAGLLAIPILSGSATYAIKEFLGLPGSLASKPQQRPTFYIILTLATVAGVVMNFMHLDPIRALFLSAVINGVVAPPLLLLIVLLGRDPAVMRRYVSGTLSLALTAIATVFMAGAAITMFATMFTGR